MTSVQYSQLELSSQLWSMECAVRPETHTEYYVGVPTPTDFFIVNTLRRTSWICPHPYFFIRVSK